MRFLITRAVSARRVSQLSKPNLHQIYNLHSYIVPSSTLVTIQRSTKYIVQYTITPHVARCTHRVQITHHVGYYWRYPGRV